MKRIVLIILSLLFMINIIFAISPDEIIKRVDKNEVFKSIKYSGIMTIKKGNRRKPRIKTFDAIALGKNKAYIEFTNPGDRGTKYLKLNNEMWIKGTYAERPDKISGHKLRESMMGSDFSYEDSMDNDKLINQYKPKLIGEEKVGNRDCYKLELTAKKKKITYNKQMIWVDKERFVAMKVQFFALSGMLLKELFVQKVKKIKVRYYPVKIKMVNKQRRNSYTLFEMKSIALDEPIKASVFSKRNLER